MTRLRVATDAEPAQSVALSLSVFLGSVFLLHSDPLRRASQIVHC